MTEVAKLTLAAAMALAVAAAYARAEPNPVTAPEVVTALEQAYGVHPGQRRNHTKGMCAEGSFVGSQDVAAYSRSALFSGATIPVFARFSLAGGNLCSVACATRKAPKTTTQHHRSVQPRMADTRLAAM